MSRLLKILLVCICVAAENSVVQGCLRSGPSDEDFRALREEVRSVKRELHHLENKHENFVSESRGRKSNTEATVNNAESIIERLDKFEVKQSELEQNTKAANATKQLIKKTVDNLEKQINDKIKTLHNVLAELEEKLNKGHGALEGSMQNIETSTKKKFEEIRKVLKENGETAEEKHVFILDSLDKLNSAVNSDLKTKVADFDMHITSIRTSKDEADKLLEELQTVVEKIRPNTFNKDSAVKAFLVVVVFVLILAFWVFKLQQSVTELKKYP